MSSRRAALIVITVVVLMIPAQDVYPDGTCVSGFRAVFQKITEPVRRVQQAVHDLLMRKGRVQADAVQKILDDKAAESGTASWDDTVKKWEDEATDRMTSKGAKYPSIEEFLALMAAKSPTFKEGLIDFLNDHGTIRFKVLAGFMRTEGKVSFGSHFWDLWRTRIKLPARETWTSDDFALFMTETSNALFRGIHPEPGFATTWIKAFGTVRLNPESWKLWKTFADRFLLDYRARYKSFMEGVTNEAYGRPRPDVIRDFYKWGMWNAVYRRLAAAKVALSSKEGGAQIERSTGLKPEDIDTLSTNPLYSRLPRAVKNAIIIARNPELYKDVLYSNEVEQLSLEVMWFTQPVIEGMILYTSMIEPAFSAYEMNEQRKKYEADVRAHPDKYLPHYDKADDARLANFDDQILMLSAERTKLQSELAGSPPLSAEEQQLRRRAIDRIDRRVTGLTELKAALTKGRNN